MWHVTHSWLYVEFILLWRHLLFKIPLLGNVSVSKLDRTLFGLFPSRNKNSSCSSSRQYVSDFSCCYCYQLKVSHDSSEAIIIQPKYRPQLVCLNSSLNYSMCVRSSLMLPHQRHDVFYAVFRENFTVHRHSLILLSIPHNSHNKWLLLLLWYVVHTFLLPRVSIEFIFMETVIIFFQLLLRFFNPYFLTSS